MYNGVWSQKSAEVILMYALYFLSLFQMALVLNLETSPQFSVGDGVVLNCRLGGGDEDREIRFDDRLRVKAERTDGVLLLDIVVDESSAQLENRHDLRMRSEADLLLAWKQPPPRGAFWESRSLLRIAAPSDYGDSSTNARLTRSHFSGPQSDPLITESSYEGYCAVGVF